MPRFSANISMLFKELPLSQRFRAARDCGFSAIEIQFPYELSALEIKQQLQDNEQKLVLFNVDADDLLTGGLGLACVPEKREKFRQALNQTLEYCEILQPDCINLLPGLCKNAELRTEYLQTFDQRLIETADALAKMHIKACFESINTIDMPGFLIHNHKQMLEVLDRLEHANIYLQYDLYHMAKMQQKSHEIIPQNASRIAHIQFADVPGRGQPGSGTIDFSQLFETIDKSSYHGYCGAEYIPTEDNSQASFDWLHDYSKQ